MASPVERYLTFLRRKWHIERPTTFAQIHEWLLAAAVLWVIAYVYVWHPVKHNGRFNDLAQRYENSRWHRLDGERSHANQDLEDRLKQDLDRWEHERSDSARWNQSVWQTWRNTELGHWRDTWRDLNPGWQYNLLLDDAADDLIKTTFANVPDLLKTWQTLPKPVLKADLFRYIITYTFGGFYADVDVSCVDSLDYWMPASLWNDPSVHTVIGFEYNDEHHGDQGWYRVFMFVQYAMLSRPLSGAMRQAFVNALIYSHHLTEMQGVSSVSDVNWSFDAVLKTTGPIALTDGVFAAIMKDTGLSRPQIFKELYGRTKPHKIGGTVVLPPYEWFAGGKSIPAQYYLHHGQGSWL